MKKLISICSGIFFTATFYAQIQKDYVPLKELFKNDFLIGVAVNSRTITGVAGKMVIDNFNTITCENEMKPQSLLYFPFQRPSGAPQGQLPQQAQQDQQQGAAQGGQPVQRTGGFAQIPLKLDTIKGLVYNWALADQIADFARSNNLKMRGHTLVWHSQTPAGFFYR